MKLFRSFSFLLVFLGGGGGLGLSSSSASEAIIIINKTITNVDIEKNNVPSYNEIQKLNPGRYESVALSGEYLFITSDSTKVGIFKLNDAQEEEPFIFEYHLDIGQLHDDTRIQSLTAVTPTTTKTTTTTSSSSTSKELYVLPIFDHINHLHEPPPNTTIIDYFTLSPSTEPTLPSTSSMTRNNRPQLQQVINVLPRKDGIYNYPTGIFTCVVHENVLVTEPIYSNVTIAKNDYDGEYHMKDSTSPPYRDVRIFHRILLGGANGDDDGNTNDDDTESTKTTNTMIWKETQQISVPNQISQVQVYGDTIVISGYAPFDYYGEESAQQRSGRLYNPRLLIYTKEDGNGYGDDDNEDGGSRSLLYKETQTISFPVTYSPVSVALNDGTMVVTNDHEIRIYERNVRLWEMVAVYNIPDFGVAVSVTMRQNNTFVVSTGDENFYGGFNVSPDNSAKFLVFTRREDGLIDKGDENDDEGEKTSPSSSWEIVGILAPSDNKNDDKVVSEFRISMDEEHIAALGIGNGFPSVYIFDYCNKFDICTTNNKRQEQSSSASSRHVAPGAAAVLWTCTIVLSIFAYYSL